MLWIMHAKENDEWYSSNGRQEKGQDSNWIPTACYSRHRMWWKRRLSDLVAIRN